MIAEEYLIKNYKIETLQIVGIEGFWGVLICLIVVPILNFVPCTF